MVQTLEAIKGGGGSVKVGTTGTIGALMSKELECTRYAAQTAVSTRDKSPAVTISVPSVATSPKRSRPRPSANEASSSSFSSSINNSNSLIIRKTKNYAKKTHNIPMLNSDNVSLDGTPRREKSDKIVEVVDVKCGNPDRTWASPLANRLKKLGFSKLSESIV